MPEYSPVIGTKKQRLSKMQKSAATEIKISDYTYELPDERIAKYPLPMRDRSRLLQYKSGEITDHRFFEIDRLVPANSLMVFNNTRVIHARLFFQKPTGAVIEIFCLSPENPRDYQLNFQQRDKCTWNCMIGNARRWRSEDLHLNLKMGNSTITLSAKKTTVTNGEWLVEFSWDNRDYTFSELLEAAGKLPIPPYLNRESEEKDDETYQTIYSKIEGSVAAPTAGLHFTPEIMDALHQISVRTSYVTLHVGAGTFKPVKSENIGNHDMHTEFIVLSRAVIQELYDNNAPLIVVGTTSLRTVESLYYIGAKIAANPDIDAQHLKVSQWEPYENSFEITPKAALETIIGYLDKNKMSHLFAETQIIIVPGYRFHYPQAIITNFHQPESTLLLLIAAFAGSGWRKIYNHALQNDYRFLSYGDSSLIWKDAEETGESVQHAHF